MAEAVAPARGLRWAALSDAGRVRPNNEDLPLVDPDRGLFGVIDGVGGHAAGETAAAIARDVILQRLARPLGTPAERVREAIAIANNEIYRRASTTPALTGMTCVVTMALVAEGRVTVGHVGDTRLYKMRGASLVKLTHDHSPVGEREDAREIDEATAMRHPRRHEVFRDVGSILRDKDEPEYVEVVDAAFEDDAALLACSDGLTDMIASSRVADIVAAHAGQPDTVVAELVAAANEAGGRDNVTVVYAEGPAFASTVRAVLSSESGGADSSTARRQTDSATTAGASRHAGRTPMRGLWFAAGLLTGLLVAAGLTWWLLREPTVGGRTLVAAATASETVPSLTQALASARPGDVIRLEPGTYAESVILPDGVSLRARVSGASAFVRPAGAVGEWVAVLADGAGIVSGIRLTSTAEAPLDEGVRVRGQGRALELLQAEGPMRAAIHIAENASASLQGSRLAVAGTAVRVAPRGTLEAFGNVLVREPADGNVDGLDRAVVVGDGGRADVRQSVFAGFGAAPLVGVPRSAAELAAAGNVIVVSEPAAPRRPAGAR